MRRLPSLIALRFFEETARHMSFNRAAIALCVTQGAVSRQIRLLEESVGAKLFERDHKGIRLTPAGLLLLPCLSDAFDTIERGFRQISASKGRRRLMLAVPPTFATQWFSPRLGSLAVELPDVELSVRTEGQGDFHCRVRFGREALPDGHSELLLIERHVLVGAPRLLDQPLDALLDRCRRCTCCTTTRRLDLWPNWLAKAGMPARYAENGIEFSTLEQAIRAATKGAGLAIVDRNMIVEELADGGLAQFSGIEVTRAVRLLAGHSAEARRPGTCAGVRGMDAGGSSEDEEVRRWRRCDCGKHVGNRLTQKAAGMKGRLSIGAAFSRHGVETTRRNLRYIDFLNGAPDAHAAR